MNAPNLYDDEIRAGAYANLEFPGTYYLAYRDLPAIIGEHVKGTRVLDFGCGTGRSTRFLREMGFETAVGADIAARMVELARQRDPQGEYRLLPDGDLSEFASGGYDLVTCIFTFDNVSTMEKKISIFRSLRRLLADGGRIVCLVSSPEIYVNEWASFTTKDFPENRLAKSGDKVRIVMLDVEDRRPVEDIIWSDEGYQEAFKRAWLVPIKTYRPLANQTEPHDWVSEVEIAPWVIYVLEK